MDGVSWDDFRLIKAIADHRSLTGAADALGVNHSTVFRRLADTEKRIGVPLFERHRTGYGLTPAGEEMVALAERMDRDVTSFARKLAGQTLTPSGEVRVTTNDTLLVHLVMPVIAAFRASYSDMRVDMVLSNQALNLSKRDADIAVRATDNPPETLVGRRVASIAWAVYGRRTDFPGAAPEKVNPDDLDGCTWVSLGDQFCHLKAARFVRDQVPADRVALKINTVLGLTEAVEAGIGVGPLPCFIADRRPELMRVTPINSDFGTGLWLLTHPDLRASPRIRAFLDCAAAELVKVRPLIEGDRPAHAGSPREIPQPAT
jgi:DNA-binding transcriptional LysR family regulator